MSSLVVKRPTQKIPATAAALPPFSKNTAWVNVDGLVLLYCLVLTSAAKPRDIVK
jgi:hypothetical protein